MQKMENLANQNNNIKRILLIYSGLNTGGIQTLIVRMIKWFCRNDYLVTLFLYGGEGELIKYLKNLKNLTIIINNYNHLCDKSVLSKILLRLPTRLFLEIQISYLHKKYLRNQKYDLIYSFDPESFIISYLFDGKIYLSGVYHPKVYYKESRQSIIKYLRVLDKDFIDKIVFMSESVKYNTEKYFHKKLKGGIFPLPIEISERREILKEESDYKRYNSRKIISIGRIVDFKTYNFYMVDIIESLIKKYPQIEYHVYGFGPLEEKLIDKINKSNCKKNIFYHGELKYSKMANILKDCFCFVGGGTSLIEACLFDIPGIAAIGYDNEAKSNGFLYELPKYECGGLKDDVNAKYKVKKLIEELLTISKDEYKLISKKCRSKAKEFDIENVMPDFMEYINTLEKQPKIKKPNCIKLFILRLLNFFRKK